MHLLAYLPIFEALGHETRLKAFDFIYRSGRSGVRPKEMINNFGFDSGTLDFHLKKLLAAKLIVLKIGGRRGVYCASENIPHELVELFESAGTKLLISSPKVSPGSKLEFFH